MATDNGVTSKSTVASVRLPNGSVLPQKLYVKWPWYD